MHETDQQRVTGSRSESREVKRRITSATNMTQGNISRQLLLLQVLLILGGELPG